MEESAIGGRGLLALGRVQGFQWRRAHPDGVFQRRPDEEAHQEGKARNRRRPEKLSRQPDPLRHPESDDRAPAAAETMAGNHEPGVV